MNKLFIVALTLLFPFALFGENDSQDEANQTENNPVSNFSGVPSGIIDNCVNVVTGDFFIHDSDIVVQGYEPLTLQRSYCSSDGLRGSLCYGWHLNHYGKMLMGLTEGDKYKKERFHATLTGSNGSKILYEEKISRNPVVLTASQSMFKAGYTNCSNAGGISGRTDRNNDRVYPQNKKLTRAYVLDGSNIEKFYKNIEGSDGVYLQHIKKSDGLLYRFDYKGKKIQRVNLYNPSSENIAYLSIDYPKHSELAEDSQIEISGADGTKAVYTLTEQDTAQKRSKQCFLKHVSRDTGPSVSYEYEQFYLGYGKSSRINKKVLPEGRYLNIQYYQEGKQTIAGREERIKREYDPRRHRVAQLSAPVGTTDFPIVTYQFLYEFDHLGNEGKAIVFNAYNQQVNYIIAGRRLKKIEYFKGQGANYFYKQEKYSWSDKGELTSSALDNHMGWTQICKHCRYDNKGNILEERLYGNLTGNNNKPLDILPSGARATPDVNIIPPNTPITPTILLRQRMMAKPSKNTSMTAVIC